MEVPPLSPRGLNHWLTLAVLSTFVFGLWLAVLGDALSDDPIGTAVRGGVADWLVVKEAWAGDDAYKPVPDLADTWLDLRHVTPDSPHPRPPSAIVTLSPLGVVPSGDVVVVLAMVMSICLVVTIDLWASWLDISQPVAWAMTVVVGMSVSMLQGAAWGSHVPLVALCIATFVIAPFRRGRWLPGTLGGIAVGLKLFPALVVLTRVKSRPRQFVLTAATFGGLTLAGLILPGVDLQRAWGAITSAPAEFAGTSIDMSLAAQLGVEDTAIAFLIPVMAIALVPLLWRIDDVPDQVALATILTLLAAPMAWPEYQLLAVPVAMVLWNRSIVGKTAAAIWMAVIAVTLDGTIQFLALILLAVTLLFERARITLPRPPRVARV